MNQLQRVDLQARDPVSKSELRRLQVQMVDHHPDKVFVFGSNLAGIHGAGAAYFAAIKRGFPGRLGVGPAENCYAIPTKDSVVEILPLETILIYVIQFKAFAEMMGGADVQFQVTQIGCGLAGYKAADIAPMFQDAPENCWFDYAWKDILGLGTTLVPRKYWGTV